MAILFVLIATPALMGSILCRWTAVHPLVASLALWLLATVLVFVTLAGFMVADSLVVAPVVALVPAVAGALGGFLGWLRRTHVKRMS